jgi:hypothetical protein
MARKIEPTNTGIQVPWVSAQNPNVDNVIQILVQQLGEQHKIDQREPDFLTDRQKGKLQQSFKNSALGRGPVSRFMLGLAKAIEIDDPDSAVIMAPMKSWWRAAHKLNTTGKPLTDLGRGRIVVESLEQVNNFYKLLTRKKNGYIQGIPTQASITEGSLDDYLKNQRWSGYAGSINFDVQTDLGKGRKGDLEIQIMPKSYINDDIRSHYLFSMIRILHEIPEAFRSSAQKYVLTGLALANAALFDEQAIRSGFDSLRKVPIRKITVYEFQHAFDVLDRTRTQIERFPGRRYAWQEKTMDALTYSKSSVANLFAGHISPDFAKELTNS